MTTLDTKRARQALCDLPVEVSLSRKPETRNVYLPPAHLKALNQRVQLVVGMRGAGKTFWCNALQEAPVRELIYQIDPDTSLGKNTEVRVGFSEEPAFKNYPDIDTIQYLVGEDGVEPRKIWQTILIWHVTRARNTVEEGDHPLRELDWKGRVAYVREHSESMTSLLEEYDSCLDSQQHDFLILFDALDRCARDRRTTYALIQGLMQMALEMRSFRHLRIKIFLRPDQKDAREITTFPDAARALSSHVTLGWPSHELYNLLWHLLLNGEYGKDFREFLGPDTWKLLEWEGSGKIYLVSRGPISRREKQRTKFHEIAGEWMGANRKRGFPYTWIPNHLADTDGRVSPRSFLVALKKAAEKTEEHYPGHEYALHYKGINHGIQLASERRIMEITEDYPWADEALCALKGIMVPCEFQEIRDRWKEEKLLKNFKKISLKKKNKVLHQPPSIEDGPQGVRGDLEELCVFYRLRDDRVHIPDVFRVGYGMGRKGGIKPAR